MTASVFAAAFPARAAPPAEKNPPGPKPEETMQLLEFLGTPEAGNETWNGFLDSLPEQPDDAGAAGPGVAAKDPDKGS